MGRWAECAVLGYSESLFTLILPWVTHSACLKRRPWRHTFTVAMVIAHLCRRSATVFVSILLQQAQKNRLRGVGVAVVAGSGFYRQRVPEQFIHLLIGQS